MRQTRTDRGFTLTEVLVVLVIVGLLVGLVGPRVIGYLSSSRTDVAEIQIEQFSTALELYALDIGRFPTEDEGLAALITAPADSAGWNGPYLRKDEVPLDPWGNAYVYTTDGTTFSLRSSGAESASAQ